MDKSLEQISLPKGDFPVLWSSNKRLPEKAQFGAIIERCFLLLDADTLRKSGAMISNRVSWERTATELVWQLENNPALSYINKTPHILITFAEDGAVYLKREHGMPKSVLALAHGGSEGAVRKEKNLIPDVGFAWMTATLAKQFVDVLAGRNSLHILPVLQSANNDSADGISFDEILNRNMTESNANILPEQEERVFEIPFTPGQSEIDPDFWCISNSVDNRRIFDLAYEYVLKGAKVIEGLPRLSFSALTTIDRQEIESYRNICNLVENYVRSDNVRPLSIAVFGAPGSGKSFGVTQIAENIAPGKVQKLEFNVSQFTNNNDLGVAFQKVRDVTLEGKLPLVFFDEFDSDRNGIQLGWIKNFLMPMQDGKFKDESGEHPLGRCILVFAGGTSTSFEEFTCPMLSACHEEQRKFKDVKGPDFVSRLRGTIDVLGPNQSNANDKNYILRRALLLRSLCERKLKVKKDDKAFLNTNILRAMLLVPKYKHGARSMEAIIDMSRIEGNVWEPVSLPFYSQLSLHVDADAFIKLVLREVILNSYLEKMAMTIHEQYSNGMLVTGNAGHPSAVPWNELSEEFKDSNRNQARDIAAKLKHIGHEYDTGDTPFPSVEQFDEDTILFLAKEEHDRWMKEKKANGWKYAPLPEGIDKIVAIKEMREQKLSHLLVEWDLLDAEEQNKDISAVRNIIPMLKNAGLRVYKVE
jgi:hypothetical protein